MLVRIMSRPGRGRRTLSKTKDFEARHRHGAAVWKRIPGGYRSTCRHWGPFMLASSLHIPCLYKSSKDDLRLCILSHLPHICFPLAHHFTHPRKMIAFRFSVTSILLGLLSVLATSTPLPSSPVQDAVDLVARLQPVTCDITKAALPTGRLSLAVMTGVPL